ncbi:MAG TPA: glycine dehydrogenase, partial [Chloroflexota bacterium]
MSFVPLTATEREDMLRTIGVAGTDDLFDVIPNPLRYPEIDIGPELTELEATRTLEALADANHPPNGTPFFLGGGAYRHFVPAAVNALVSRGEFATSYTPYQPEVSQGTLQATFEFQSMVCALTGLDVSNSSVYDGASAVAEAALMAMRLTGRGRIVVSGGVHPHYREVLQSYVQAREADIVTTRIGLSSNGMAASVSPLSLTLPREGGGDPRVGDQRIVEDDLVGQIDGETACCIVSQPTFFGEIRDLARIVAAAHERGALVIEVYNPTSLGLLRAPGAWGADIAVGEGQPLGLSLSYGGPYVGLMSCRQ